MNESQENKCHAIIHSAATGCAAIAAGLAQIPGSDSALIVPVQMAMIVSLGAVFGIQLTESTAQATLATATSTMIGRGISQWLVGWIPGWGNALNASTAFAVTESIGWTIANNYVAQQKLPVYR